MGGPERQRAPRPLLHEFPLGFHLPDAAAAVVFEFVGEVDEGEDVFLWVGVSFVLLA